MAGVDHLAEQVGGCLALVCIMLEALDPGTQLGQLRNCTGVLFVFESCFLFVCLHLGFGSTPLATNLQHVGPDALDHYQTQIKFKRGRLRGTYD